MAYKVLIVEDNPDMRISLSSYLKSEGMMVTDTSSAEEGIDLVDENRFDVAIIDINLPGKSGFELIEYIREQGYDTPLLAMTARDGIDDKLRGFDLGLTDYIVKPFNVRELYARLLVHVGKAGFSDDQPLKKGMFDINPKKLTFSVNNEPIELTQLEFKIIYLLLSSADTIVKVDDIIEYAWGDGSDIIAPPIRIHIANLRKKIDDNNFDIIRTIPGQGYILNTSKDHK